MKNIRIIARADDAGSSISANIAIYKALQAGFIKNVSLMAPGPFMDNAELLLKGEKNVCFGIHATLNAEWDKGKWGPLTDIGVESGLVDSQGYFLATPAIFLQTKPGIETVLREYNAQLDKLTKLGFEITYVDSHMYEEGFIEGLSTAKREWAAGKGLIYHMDYDNQPENNNPEENLHNLGQYFYSLPDGQYLFVTHPAIYSDEMINRTGNAEITGCEVARIRDLEAKAITDLDFIKFIRSNGITAIRYDEAALA